MSETQQPQFDRAEFDGAPAASPCAACSTPLNDYYYEVNGQVVCERCRYELERRLTAGSGAGRVLRATAAGFGAAVLGALLYYAISALTGYEFGLIAIAVGYGVGVAVRWGSSARGGWLYQTIAVGLTYLAIVSTYIPPIIRGFQEAATQQTAAATTTVPAAETNAEAAAPEPLTATSFAIAILFLVAIAMVAPFLGGLQNIIGLIIIGIGLYEAWKLNRRNELTITGPHTLANPAVV